MKSRFNKKSSIGYIAGALTAIGALTASANAGVIPGLQSGESVSISMHNKENTYDNPLAQSTSASGAVALNNQFYIGDFNILSTSPTEIFASVDGFYLTEIRGASGLPLAVGNSDGSAPHTLFAAAALNTFGNTRILEFVAGSTASSTLSLTPNVDDIGEFALSIQDIDTTFADNQFDTTIDPSLTMLSVLNHLATDADTFFSYLRHDNGGAIGFPQTGEINASGLDPLFPNPFNITVTTDRPIGTPLSAVPEPSPAILFGMLFALGYLGYRPKRKNVQFVAKKEDNPFKNPETIFEQSYDVDVMTTTLEGIPEATYTVLINDEIYSYLENEPVEVSTPSNETVVLAHS